jgi:3-hydroxyacyl-[acyl-carrier-protein] dehydratase
MTGLYEITEGQEEGLFDVRLNPGHSIFRGHFPGNPVLPGICSLMIIRRCASRTAGKPLRYVSVQESKFLSAITPDTEPIVKLKLTCDGNIHSVAATIYGGDATMLTLKATLTADE